MSIGPKRLRVLVGVTACLLGFGCTAEYSPSIGITVQVLNRSVSRDDVYRFAAERLRSEGFRDIGKDGRDKMLNTRNAYYFRDSQGALVSIDVYLEDKINIRLSEDADRVSPRSHEVMNDLAESIAAKWKDSVKLNKTQRD
jgi:hypothetical protein